MSESTGRAWASLAIFATTALFVFFVVAALGLFDEHPYKDCAPTEVYAWRADTETRESGWQCTAVADLIVEVK